MSVISNLHIKLRILRGEMTQVDAAALCNVGVKSWSTWESGYRTANLRLVTLERICDAFGEDLYHFLRWTPRPSLIEEWREYDRVNKLAQLRCYEREPIVVDSSKREPTDAELDAIALNLRRREANRL
jgi:transcriptional regulator with XRE-family HTH domain